MSGWIEYDSNNSGGSFWLKDADWQALEEAGWTVNWILVTERDSYSKGGAKYVAAQAGRTYADTREAAFAGPPKVGEPRWPDAKVNGEVVVAVARTYEEALALREKYGGYFGCLAISCTKEGVDPETLIAEFERVANQNASDEGCNCCGPPHSFTWHADDGTSRHASVEVTETRLVWS